MMRMKVALSLLLLLSLSSDSNGRSSDDQFILKIGGLFETGDESIEMAFKYASDRMNQMNLIKPYRLAPHSEKLERGDSFQASKRVCNLLNEGVLAVFGPQSVETSTHIQSTCEVLNMPHLETRWDYRLEPANHSTNLYPQPLSLGNAFRDLVKLKNWKSFAILYEENDGLVRVQEVLKDADLREEKIVVRQFETEEYRKVFKEIGKLGIRNIILDVPREHIQSVLRHAQQVEMLSEYHNYIFTSLDLSTVDLEDFQYSGTNISSFSLIDTSSLVYNDVIREWQSTASGDLKVQRSGPGTVPWIQQADPESTEMKGSLQNFTTEVALMYDAVILFANALAQLHSTKPIQIQRLSCETEESWSYGWAITNFMKMISVEGVTGTVKFDENGFRSDFKLRLQELTREGLRVVGHWNTTGVFFMPNYTKAMAEGYRQTLKNRTLTVVTKLNSPYSMEVDDWRTLGLEGNDIYEGYCIDLIKEISEILGFKYVIKLVGDNKYGKRDPRTGEWNGLIRELIDGKADVAITDLTITYERESAVDFSMPFMNLGIGILFRKPKKEPPKLFSFMSPLAIEVWIYLLTAFLGVTLFLFVIARFSPYEWVNPHPCVRDPDELENNFTMKNTLWFTIGCLMQQGCDIMPRALSTRVLAASWWFFILILVSSYTANLAAFLTVERMVNPIESAEDLAKQTKIHYGCVGSGSTQAFFKNSNFTTYARMWSFMESTRPSVFVESTAKGVERVKKGDYAFLMESTSIEYLLERECDLYQVGGLLDSKGYGIATPSESPYRSLISDAILQLQESGTLHQLKIRWWSEKKGGGVCGPKDGAQKAAGAASELGLANVGGVFVVLAAGSVIAIAICVSEFIWKMKQIPPTERDHIFIELMRELKHVICCYGSTRPVRKTIDDYGSQVMIGSQGNIPSGMNGNAPFMPMGGSYDEEGPDSAPPGDDVYFPSSLQGNNKQEFEGGNLLMYQEAATQSSEQGSLMDSKPFVSALSNLLEHQLTSGQQQQSVLLTSGQQQQSGLFTNGQQQQSGLFTNGQQQQSGLGTIREDIFRHESSFDDPSLMKSRSGINPIHGQGMIGSGQGMIGSIGSNQGMMISNKIVHSGMISHQSSGAEIEAHHNNLSRGGAPGGMGDGQQQRHPMLIGGSSNIRPGSKIAFVLDSGSSLDSSQPPGGHSGPQGGQMAPGGYYRYSQEENASDV